MQDQNLKNYKKEKKKNIIDFVYGKEKQGISPCMKILVSKINLCSV